VDAVSTDDVILTGMIIQDDSLKLVEAEPLTTEPYGVGIKDGDKQVQDLVNEVIADYKSSGAWADAYEKWVGQYTDEKQDPPTITLQEALDIGS
jgi:ABC-type amino acid transport substrate-binding protein